MTGPLDLPPELQALRDAEPPELRDAWDHGATDGSSYPPPTPTRPHPVGRVVRSGRENSAAADRASERGFIAAYRHRLGIPTSPQPTTRRTP